MRPELQTACLNAGGVGCGVCLFVFSLRLLAARVLACTRLPLHLAIYCCAGQVKQLNDLRTWCSTRDVFRARH